MSTQQDIYAAGSESCPSMLNKENYVPWSSRLLWYAKSRSNGKLIHNSILNCPYVRQMIPKPGDANREVNVTETFHLQIDDELSNKELKQIEVNDQAIHTILFGLPEDIYAAVDSCETTQEIWLRPEWSRHVTIVHQTKDLHTANYTQLYDFLKYNQKEVDELKSERLAKTQDPLALMANSNNPYRISSNTRNMQIAQPGMNMGQDRQMQMVGGNGGNQFRQYAGQNVGNPNGYNDVTGNQVNQNAVQNPRVQNIGNQNGLISVQGNGNQNQIGNGNLVAARAEGNAPGQNRNQIRCYNCRGVEEYDLMAAAANLDEIKEVNANCILMANMQQASTSGTQTDSAPVYDTDGSAKNDNDVISKDTSVEQGGETVEQHPANFEETRALYESLYQNLAIEVEKVNSVNRKLKETNADMTTELARYKNQERCFEISQEKYDKLE
nr:hypothetical protein [Tanacetum cinerariifolium]